MAKMQLFLVVTFLFSSLVLSIDTSDSFEQIDYLHLQDHETDCGAWSDLGECEENEHYMMSHCAESCYHQHVIRSAVLLGRPFIVNCNTTVGPIEIELYPKWAPWGVERFLKLLADRWFDDSPFFRAIPRFLVQFGQSLDPDISFKWFDRPSIPDDVPHKLTGEVFERGMLAFAGNGNHSRTTQLFIAFEGSNLLGSKPWETPIGKVIHGMDRLENIAMYGDFPEFGGNGPDPDTLRGPNSKEYLKTYFKDMDYITFCRTDLPVDEHGNAMNEGEL